MTRWEILSGCWDIKQPPRLANEPTVGLGQGLRLQMRDQPLEIEASRNGKMMQMRFAQSRVRGASESRDAHRLGERASKARSSRIPLDEGWRALLGTTLLQGRMHLGWRERESATLLPTGTLSAHRTGTAGGGRKADDHRGMPAAILRLGPPHTGLPLRTSRSS